MHWKLAAMLLTQEYDRTMQHSNNAYNVENAEDEEEAYDWACEKNAEFNHLSKILKSSSAHEIEKTLQEGVKTLATKKEQSEFELEKRKRVHRLMHFAVRGNDSFEENPTGDSAFLALWRANRKKNKKKESSAAAASLDTDSDANADSRTDGLTDVQKNCGSAKAAAKAIASSAKCAANAVASYEGASDKLGTLFGDDCDSCAAAAKETDEGKPAKHKSLFGDGCPFHG